jgi:hypothetical protein
VATVSGERRHRLPNPVLAAVQGAVEWGQLELDDAIQDRPEDADLPAKPLPPVPSRVRQQQETHRPDPLPTSQPIDQAGELAGAGLGVVNDQKR